MDQQSKKEKVEVEEKRDRVEEKRKKEKRPSNLRHGLVSKNKVDRKKDEDYPFGGPHRDHRTT